MPALQASLSAFSFLLATLVLTPLTCYFRASNIAAVAVGGWLSVVNVIYAVDALIWAGDADIKAPLWCDISSSFITASHFALPAACLCICIHLERLASFSHTSVFVTKRPRILFEYTTCFVLPMVYTAIHLIVQPRRFDLYEGFGCRPATFPSVASIFLVWVPPMILSIGAVGYAATAAWHFLVQGVHFSRDNGRPSASSLTCNMYVRLVGMAVVQVLFSIVTAALGMWYTLSSGVLPFSKMSRNFDEVLIWDSNAITPTVRAVLLVEWIGVMVQSALFFGLFALRKDFIEKGVGQMRAMPDTVKSWLLRAPGRGRTGSGSLMDSAVRTPSPILPVTILDSAVDVDKSSNESRRGPSIVPEELSSPESTLRPTRPPSLDLGRWDGDVAVVVVDSSELLDPTLLPLESPSGFSTIPSSHNSLDSGFDPHRVVLPLEDWPKPPVTIPVLIGPCRPLSKDGGVGDSPVRNIPRSRPSLSVSRKVTYYRRNSIRMPLTRATDKENSK
ncbi:pheromone A receptor-domain-containing protein [Pisolithus albus]|nr:pheromone A receptor-domain-containing protein [Pisolithus albus]